MATKKVMKKVDLSKPYNSKGIKLFKVLKNSYGKWNGGHTSFDWAPYLPSNGKPGKALVLRTKRPLLLCLYGLHVSNRPCRWGAYTAPDKYTRIFEAKVFGPVEGRLTRDDKICAYKVQLIREVYNPARPVGDATEWQRITAHTYAGK